MAWRPPKNPWQGRKKTKAPKSVEWIGGIVTMPMTVQDDDGAVFQPEILVWMNQDGKIVGSTMDDPGKLLSTASQNLQSKIENPEHGRPHRPTRVRVAAPELAEKLRPDHPDIEFICAPTPELDHVLDLMREHWNANSESDPESYLTNDVSSEAMASLFDAAASLYRAAPWKHVPGDDAVFLVNSDELDLRDTTVTVIGHLGQSHGFLYFPSFDDYEAYLVAAAVGSLEPGSNIPPHAAINFERGADLSPELRKEVAKHQWKVAASKAYPYLTVLEANLIDVSPTLRDVTIAECISRALVQVMSNKKALQDAWKGGDPVSETLRVKTPAGAFELSIATRNLRMPIGLDPSQGILYALAAFPLHDDFDSAKLQSLEDKLLDQFTNSPEGQALEEGPSTCRLIMEFGVSYFERTIGTLNAHQLRVILFDIIPRKVSIGPEEAKIIIEELHALYSFLKREFDLKQADTCLRLLNGNAVQKLEAALSDPSKFGMAKSLVMAGMNAGFDMTSPEGIETWMQLNQGKALTNSTLSPGLATLDRLAAVVDASDRANSTKSTKKSRKKTAKKTAKKDASKRASKKTSAKTSSSKKSSSKASSSKKSSSKTSSSKKSSSKASSSKKSSAKKSAAKATTKTATKKRNTKKASKTATKKA